jgi:cell division protein FtsI/penicillin-binding protein 2
LALNNDTVIEQATPGDDVYTTIDLGIQQTAEEALKNGVDKLNAIKGSAIVLEADTGAVKAIANYPSFDPTNFSNVKDASVFVNTATAQAWEPGSVLKPLLMAASFNEGKTNPGTTYFDSGSEKVADRIITNSLPWGAQTMGMQDIISKSLNTGAVYLLKTLGAGEINQSAREKYYEYLTEHFMFGKSTNIEQAGEASGIIQDPIDGYGRDVTYANMAFGQGMTTTPIQLAAAYAALVNGGTYYQPTLIAANSSNDGEAVSVTPKVVKEGVVSKKVSSQIRTLLKKGLEDNNFSAIRAGYNLGAKSGTAQIADGNGNYKKDAYNGVYVGYFGGDMPKYVMLVRLDEPKTSGFASAEAAKVWSEISNDILDNYPIPKAKN